MDRLVVERSPVRQLLFGLAGILLLVAALDIVWVHRLSLPPETTAEGLLTAKGQSMRRADIIWGSVFLVSGGILLATSLTGLLRRTPVVVVGDEGLELAIAGPRNRVFVPWSEVSGVRSGHDLEDGGGRPLAVLMVEVDKPERLPMYPWGATWDGSTLRVDAEGWTVPPEEVAVHVQVAMDRLERKKKRGPRS